jgi:hypothetical protein
MSWSAWLSREERVALRRSAGPQVDVAQRLCRDRPGVAMSPNAARLSAQRLMTPFEITTSAE